jgi:hypothetical protein
MQSEKKRLTFKVESKREDLFVKDSVFAGHIASLFLRALLFYGRFEQSVIDNGWLNCVVQATHPLFSPFFFILSLF